jgi:poly-gamma-glutamate synthesis protein (capsule biosynthesis protein)
LVVISFTAVLISIKSRSQTITSPVSPEIIKQVNAESFTPLLPTLETIFADDHSWTATLSAEKIRKVLVTGDIIPARSVNYGVSIRNNPLWPYEKVADPVKALQADIVFTNLETPLIENCPVTQVGMVFCGSNRNIDGLKHIGVTVTSVANNHFGNHGHKGVQESLQLLQDASILAAGTAGPVYKDVRGTRFAFLAYNDIDVAQKGINAADETLIAKEIAEAKTQSDVILVMFHWGVEYRAQPDDRQIYLAHYTIDQGADYVLSNHPHWIQPVELYKNKLIMYAHGNFIFDQMWSQKTREGVLGMYTFYDEQLIDVYFLPLQINDYGQAVFLNGSEKQRILQDMYQQSIIRNNNAQSGV